MAATPSASGPAPSLTELKEQICDIGRRIYAKGFAAGNDGNISFRLGPNEVLCTPTMMSKGFLEPSDLCIVDMEGNQLDGVRKRSSEILLHLTIMKERPDIRSVVHCHPPHATAFAVAREPIPQCVLPEVEVFLGDVPIARYETPGGQKLADTVKPFVRTANVVIMANHGTVSFGETVEKAYWWTEILDAYCRILILAKQIGRVSYFTTRETRELLDLKAAWGYSDTRLTGAAGNGDDAAFRARWASKAALQSAFDPPPPMGADNHDATRPVGDGAVDIEAIVRAVTEQVCRQLGVAAADPLAGRRAPPD
jgi:L-fuculose-phosphate aldolase